MGRAKGDTGGQAPAVSDQDSRGSVPLGHVASVSSPPLGDDRVYHTFCSGEKAQAQDGASAPFPATQSQALERLSHSDQRSHPKGRVNRVQNRSVSNSNQAQKDLADIPPVKKNVVAKDTYRFYVLHRVGCESS